MSANLVFFFFSSRRRHTRFDCDWSSDVCSSDLDDLPGAQQTLQRGLARIPSSGKILWGLGIVSVLQGNTAQAAQQLERAVDLLPEWAGSYSTLGVFYYQTGQFEKAREVLNRFKGSSAGGLDV